MIGLIPFKDDQKFSLKSLSVVCSIRNLLVSCTSEFVYRNDEDKDVEALFSFPLDRNCVVYYMEAKMGNKTLNGICKEVEEAKNLYKAAKEMGHMVTMIERNTSMTDVFKCRIGNFPKKSDAKIILKFATELKLSLARHEVKGIDRLNLALPLILKPRYTPDGYEGDREVYKVTNKYEYHFKASVNGTKVISNVSSVEHTLDVQYTNKNQTHAEVTLQSVYDGTKDLDINIDYMEMREPSVYYELGTGSPHYSGKHINGAFYNPDVAMVNFLPKFQVDESENQMKTEIVFVVDRSGSMQGSNIERAKECLLIFLKSLPVNCKFQIYGFGSNFDKAFNDSQLYNDQSINIALTYQKNLDANLGGTELMQPLLDLYNSPLSSDYLRVVFLLTDGDVGNQDEVTKLVRKHNKTTRLFAVGIGDGVSTSLVDQVAQSGLGKSVFVRNANELSASVIELLDVAINCNPFTDGKIEWQCPEHVSIISVPTCTPPIFSDYFLTMFCMINGMKPNDIIHCTLSGKINDKLITYVLRISDSDANTDDEFRVHRLLGKYKIDEMTTQIEDGKENIKKSLIDLSTEINIVTNWTTFVAIDQDAPEIGLFTPRLEEIQNENLCSGMSWRPPVACKLMSPAPQIMFSKKAKSAKKIKIKSNNRCMKRSMVPASYGMAFDSVDGPNDLSEISFMKDEDCLDVAYARDDIQSVVEDKDETVDIIMYLVGKQNINGSWNYDDDIFLKINLEVSKVNSKKPKLIKEEIWATGIVYQYLVSKEQAREKEWRLFAKKARQWIEKMLNDPEMLKSILQSCLDFF